MATRIIIRKDTSTNWTAINPVLSLGELALETDTGKIKCGDGTTAWSTLGYIAGDTHADNDKMYFGNSDDLELFHDGSDSYIKDVGTGDLIIQGDDVRIGHTHNEDAIICNKDSSVVIKHDNATKLATTSTGVTVTGTATATTFAASTSFTLGDWVIKLVGTNLTFEYNGTDVLELKSTGELTVIDDVTAFGTI